MANPEAMAVTQETAEVARDAARNARRGGYLTAAVSGMALVASGVSLWESTLKQPELRLYVTDSLSYTRDPWGGYEVFAVPLTIANGGARDGAVVALALEVKTAGGKSETFTASYTVDATYFGASDDVSARRRRPKLPFAPLAIAGKGAYSGTVLFYAAEGREQKLIEPKSRTDLTLKLTMPGPDGLLDRLLQAAPGPVSLTVDVPNFLPGALLSGEMARLRLVGERGKP